MPVLPFPPKHFSSLTLSLSHILFDVFPRVIYIYKLVYNTRLLIVVQKEKEKDYSM